MGVTFRLAATTLVLAASMGPAIAGEAETVINEVSLSKDGNNAIQFIEIVNYGGDLPQTGYKLELFGQSGAPIGFQVLPISTSQRRVTAATAAAREVTGYDLGATGGTGSDYLTNLSDDIALPTKGTVCLKYEERQIQCLSWGAGVLAPTGYTIEHGRIAGPAPSDGKSLQYVADCGSGPAGAGTDAPTPQDDNIATACEEPAADGSGSGSGSGSGDGDGDGDGGGGCASSGSSGFGFLGLAGVIALGARGLRRRKR